MDTRPVEDLDIQQRQEQTSWEMFLVASGNPEIVVWQKTDILEQDGLLNAENLV